ncbi:MAG: isochorismatase family protein [Novosphingobium sp.]|nr:isochorismatase family protein [Novosphingobium sp.]
MAFDMCSLLQSGRVAVLLSEVQRSIIGDLSVGPLAEAAQQAGVAPASAKLAAAAREQGAPVVHCLAVTDPDRFGSSTNARLFMAASKRNSSGTAYDPARDTPCPEVWQEGDVISRRVHGLNPMADNQLDRRLRNSGISTVIVAGVSLNVAVLNLTMDAVNNGYQVIVARDAVSGFPLDYAGPVMANTLSFISTLATVDEIIASWAKG